MRSAPWFGLPEEVPGLSAKQCRQTAHQQGAIRNCCLVERKKIGEHPTCFSAAIIDGSGKLRQGENELVVRVGAHPGLGSNDAEVYYQVVRAYGQNWIGGRTGVRHSRGFRGYPGGLARTSKTSERRSSRRERRNPRLKNGDVKSAASRLEQARTLRPSDDKILFRLAGLYFDLKPLDLYRKRAFLSKNAIFWCCSSTMPIAGSR